MRILILLLSPFLLVAQIDLGSIENRYINMSIYKGDTVDVTGYYRGDRIVLSNVDNVVIRFIDAEIESTHKEDALCFDGTVNKSAVIGSLKLNNSMTFWGMLKDVEITGLHSKGAHTGIRFTQDQPHDIVYIHDNKITDTSHEGIYAGVSYATERKVTNVRIYNNKIARTGWDAIQIGNCQYCMIEYNKITKAGTAKERWQDWAITINPGSLAYLRGNRIRRSDQAVQVLDSRAFIFDTGRVE